MKLIKKISVANKPITLDLSATTGIDTISGSFSKCLKLETIPELTNLFNKTNKIENISMLFNGCIKVQKIPCIFTKMQGIHSHNTMNLNVIRHSTGGLTLNFIVITIIR